MISGVTLEDQLAYIDEGVTVGRQHHRTERRQNKTVVGSAAASNRTLTNVTAGAASHS